MLNNIIHNRILFICIDKEDPPLQRTLELSSSHSKFSYNSQSLYNIPNHSSFLKNCLKQEFKSFLSFTPPAIRH